MSYLVFKLKKKRRKKAERGKLNFTWLPLGRLGPPGPRKKLKKDKKNSTKLTKGKKNRQQQGKEKNKIYHKKKSKKNTSRTETKKKQNPNHKRKNIMSLLRLALASLLANFSPARAQPHGRHIS